jgi:GTP cyclohydrolase II
MKKIKSMETQRKKKCDTVEAFKKLGLKPDYRNYKAEVEALKDLKLSKNIILLSSNPHKKKALENSGYLINRTLKLKHKKLSKLAQKEIKTKKEKLGYI